MIEHSEGFAPVGILGRRRAMKPPQTRSIALVLSSFSVSLAKLTCLSLPSCFFASTMKNPPFVPCSRPFTFNFIWDTRQPSHRMRRIHRCNDALGNKGPIECSRHAGGKVVSLRREGFEESVEIIGSVIIKEDSKLLCFYK